jgi:hypothetical protein
MNALWQRAFLIPLSFFLGEGQREVSRFGPRHALRL